MTRGPRWPLHPQPQPEESLSSWVFRLAQQYAMPWQEFCHGALGTEVLAEDLLDRQPPVALVHALAVRTGVPPERIWTMTLTGYVPWLRHCSGARHRGCPRGSPIGQPAAIAFRGCVSRARATTRSVWPVCVPIPSRICVSFGVWDCWGVARSMAVS